MPIFKKGLKSNPTNYRPISLTSTICRIFEKIISQQILNFLITNNLINPNQFGFLKGRSTITQLISTLQTWYETILKGDSTDCIYIYFRKAFDSVPIKFLIYKLEKLVISGKLLSWFADFLTNGTFRVKIGESFSSSYEIKSGVPQGSVLGPLLFLYYINDLPGVLPQHLHIKLYADDAKIYEHFDKNNSKLLQEGLDSIIKWSQDWALPIAHDKTFILHIGKHNTGVKYKIDNIILQETSSVRDLGIEINEFLSFNSHINKIVKNSFYRSIQLLRTIH